MRIAILFLPLAFGTAAVAQDGTTICEGAATYARSIMEARQNGVPAAETVKSADALPPGSRDIATRMMMVAYEKPIIEEPDERAAVIKSFGEDIFAECMKSY